MIRLIYKHFLSVFVFAFVMTAFTMDTQAQEMNTLWERTARTGAAEGLPSWFTVGSVRGMAYGTVDGNERIYAADRENSTIRVMDAETGADITPSTAFDLSGVGGGTFSMNDVEVSEDGVIFLGNLATDASTSPFRLYWWTTEGGAYADSLTITTATAQRLGDKFSVKGSVSDNSIEVWMPAAGSDPGIVHVATTADNGATWSINTITLSGTNTSIPSNSDAEPLTVGGSSDFYIAGNGTSPKRYTSTGAYVADSQFPAASFTGSRNGINTFQLNGEDHLSVYTYRIDGTDTGNKTGQAIVYNVADATAPVTVATSPLMGDDADTFSSIHGEAHPKVNMDGSINVYAMDGVNGFASFTNAAASTVPTDAPAAPTEDEDLVISLFSDAYSDVTVDTWRTDWSNATYKDTTFADNAVKSYTNLDFVGIETVSSQINTNGMTHLRFDLWTPDATTFRIKLVDFGPTGGFSGEGGDGEGDDSESELAWDNPAQGEWITYEIPLSDFTGLSSRANIAQIIFSGLPTANVTAYIDNIYFYNDGTAVPATIAEARAMTKGKVTIDGVMTTPDYGFNSGQFFVQDETAGVNVFYSGVGGSNNQDDPAYTGWTAGDTLSITGTLGAFNGQVQIAPEAVLVTAAGTTRPSPAVITAAELLANSDLQGSVVKIEDVRLADGEMWPADAQTSSGVNVDVVAGDSSFVLRIDRDESFFDGAPAPTERFNLLGVLARFNDEVQIMPFDSTDIANIVNVTFMVNTATHPDTLMENHYVAVFGGVNSSTGYNAPYLGQTIDWNNSTELVATNEGGDYWSVSFDMAAGDEINYKWWAGVDMNTGLQNGGETGWESGGNNYFMLPVDANADVTTDLQWYETREAPFEMKDDSTAFVFRVNVGAQIQTGDLDLTDGKVGVRGTPAFFGNPEDWGSSNLHLEEIATQGDNVFFGGVHYVPTDSLANFTDPIAYKFVIEDADGTVTWEDGDNTTFSVSSSDTTLYWKYFNNTPPTDAVIVSTALNFEVNVGILEGIGFFNSAIDTVSVRGTFNGWGDNRMTFNDISGNYDALNIPYTGAVESSVAYKYFIKWDQRRDDEGSEFFLSGITHDQSGWEEPGVTGGADRTFTLVNDPNQAVQSEFYNSVSPQALITPNNVTGGGQITVTFSIDMSAAVTRDDGTTAFNPATDSVYLFVDTPFFALTNDITVPGDNGQNFITQDFADRERIRFTDDNSDMIYTLELTLAPLTLNNIGFRIAYGDATSEDGEIIANGGGFDAGRRYYQYIQPIITADGDDLDDQPDVMWPATYQFETLTWTAEDLEWETPPDYTKITSSNEGEDDIVKRFELLQNYPNPFNPSTNISFTLPNAADVRLSVYNLLGQEVASLINGKTLNSGTHTVAFDASALSSGMYIYRIEAGNFTSTKRMMLIK